MAEQTEQKKYDYDILVTTDFQGDFVTGVLKNDVALAVEDAVGGAALHVEVIDDLVEVRALNGPGTARPSGADGEDVSGNVNTGESALLGGGGVAVDGAVQMQNGEELTADINVEPATRSHTVAENFSPSHCWPLPSRLTSSLST